MSVTRLTTPARPASEGEIYSLPRGSETAFQRIQRLQAEARGLAREEIEALCRDLTALAERAAQIGEGGDAYPAGVRDMAARLSVELPDRAHGMQAIAERMATGR